MRILKNLFEQNKAWAARLKETDPQFFTKLSTQQENNNLSEDHELYGRQIHGFHPSVYDLLSTEQRKGGRENA